VLLGTASRAVLSPVAQAVAGTRFAGEARRRAISRLTSAVTVAPILGVPLLTTVATAAGWRAAFGALALLAAVAIGLLTLAVPRDAAGARRPLRLRTVRAAYRPLLGHPPTLGIIGASLLRSMAVWGMFTYFGAFLVERHGLSSQEVGWAYMLTGLGGLAGSWAAGGRLGRAPLRPLLMGAGVALALLLAAVLILPVGAAAAAVLAAAATAGIAFTAVVGTTLLTAESPAGRATTLTVNQTAFSLGTAAGSSLGGALLAAGGYAALGLGLPLCGLASALLLWLTRPGRRPAGAPALAPAAQVAGRGPAQSAR
jgi:predicted MFS family arabinose efflux permease